MLDFLIVGSMKAGTTSLAFHLNNHKRIHIPQEELHFFDKDKNYNRGYDFYLNLFNCRSNGQQIIGEKTPTYSYLPKVPERIYKFAPDIRLIWIFRNPIDRSYSNYWHAVKSGAEKLDFCKAIERESERIEENIFKGYIERSIYSKQVKRYLNYFNKEQMYFVLFEDFIKDIEGELEDIFDFLDVDLDNFEYINEVRNKTVLPWSKKLLWLSRQFFGRGFSKKIVYNILTLGKTSGYPKLDKETRYKLAKLFRPYNKELEELTELNLNTWKE